MKKKKGKNEGCIFSLHIMFFFIYQRLPIPEAAVGVPAGGQVEIHVRSVVGGRSSDCSQAETRRSVAVKDVAGGHPAGGCQAVVEVALGSEPLGSGLWLHQAGLFGSPENIKEISTNNKCCYEKYRKS